MKEGNYYVGKFINESTYEDFPQEVKNKAKICVMDLIGALIGGSQTKAFKIASNFSQNIWSGKESTILIEKKKCNCVGAAFANSVAANAIDIDDGYRPVKGHPGALIIPAALSVGEWLKKSGKEILEAVIIGYEIGTRAGVIWHDHYPVYHASFSSSCF
jgi:2-methylcitrate dehydratase PrpD